MLTAACGVSIPCLLISSLWDESLKQVRGEDNHNIVLMNNQCRQPFVLRLKLYRFQKVQIISIHTVKMLFLFTIL